jgi:hypothetical protein
MGKFIKQYLISEGILPHFLFVPVYRPLYPSIVVLAATYMMGFLRQENFLFSILIVFYSAY